MENSIDIPLKAKDRATIWSSNPIPGHISRKDKNSNSKNYIHPNVHSSTVYNNQDMRACSVTSVVSDSETPWTMARQAPLSMGFSRPEYWSGLPFPSPVIKVWNEWSEWSEVAQLCPTLSDPIDCSPPGSSIHGIFQARVLEWGAIAFSGKLA